MSITQGIWRVTNDGLHVYSEKTEQDIASCPITSTRTPCREEAEANARLIAAAPELLEVCRRLSRVTSAINSAQHAGVRVCAELWSDLHQLTNEAKAAIAAAE